MKTLKICTLILLISTNCNCQTATPCGDISSGWDLIKGNTYYSNIYQDSTHDSVDLFNKVYTQIKTLEGVNDISIINGGIELKIENHKVDYKKQGVSWSNLCICFIHPMDFNVSIQFKNFKYKVTISNIVTHIPGTYGSTIQYIWNQDIYNKKGCINKLNRQTLLNSLDVLRIDFTQMFVLMDKVKSDW